MPGPFEPRSWAYAHPDGTFGNRFDDPVIHLPEAQRFQVLYCATKRHVAGMPALPQAIHPDDEDLLKIAALFDLTIETLGGSGYFYRP